MFVNISERYGGQEQVTIADYQQLNPTGMFDILNASDGRFIEEILNDGNPEFVAVWRNDPAPVAPPVPVRKSKVSLLGCFPGDIRSYVCVFRTRSDGFIRSPRHYSPCRKTREILVDVVNRMAGGDHSYFAPLPDGWIFGR